MKPISIMYNIKKIISGKDDTIGVVIKRANMIIVFNEEGDTLCTKTGDEVIGYTCKTFAIRKGKAIQVFDCTGQPLYSRPC